MTFNRLSITITTIINYLSDLTTIIIGHEKLSIECCDFRSRPFLGVEAKLATCWSFYCLASEAIMLPLLLAARTCAAGLRDSRLSATLSVRLIDWQTCVAVLNEQTGQTSIKNNPFLR